jgi:predicted metal-dependent HD superfamily phosphohydrolase
MGDEAELRTAWSAIMPISPRSREVLDDVIGRHRQEHRRYHGLRHVVWVLRHARALESVVPECTGCATTYDAAAVAAAAFFHDAIYDPTSDDNEERSAVLAGHQLGSLGWPEDRISIVASLVRATAGHVGDAAPAVGAGTSSRQPSPAERNVLLDADLAVLGSEPNAYGAYATGVRSEYNHLTNAQWAAGRAAVLRRLLERHSLYRTEPARAWWESRARANLTAELAVLAMPA